MGRYDAEIQSVLEAIAADGQAVTWRRIRNGTASDSEPWNDSGQTASNSTVSVLFLPASMGTTARKSPVSRGHSQDTNVPVNLLVAYVGQLPFEPSLKDVIIRDGKELRIQAIDPLNPSGQTILYQLQLLQ